MKEVYYGKSLEQEVAELNTVTNWTLEEAQRQAHASYLRNFKSYLQSVRSDRQMKQRYEFMHAQAEIWQPPTEDHQGLKDFMISQLAESQEFDLVDDFEQYRPTRMSGEEYKAQRVESLARNIGYSVERLFAAEDSAAKATSWVQDLQESLDSWQPVELPGHQLPPRTIE